MTEAQLQSIGRATVRVATAAAHATQFFLLVRLSVSFRVACVRSKTDDLRFCCHCFCISHHGTYNEVAMRAREADGVRGRQPEIEAAENSMHVRLEEGYLLV